MKVNTIIHFSRLKRRMFPLIAHCCVALTHETNYESLTKVLSSQYCLDIEYPVNVRARATITYVTRPYIYGCPSALGAP